VKCKGSTGGLTLNRSIHNIITTLYPEAYKMRKISLAVKRCAGIQLQVCAA